MQTERESLTLAEAVADGFEVDWERAESSATDADERDVIRQLRKLAAIGLASRAEITAWGPLEVREQIGSGSFGTVYRARDARLDREVALKLLRLQDAQQALATRVIHEGRLLAKIRHPNIVTVYGADVFDERVGIWMEFVTGLTLKAIVVQQGPFGAHEAALIGRDLCRALAAVHRQGYLHHDIKAQNVMREAGGRTVLMDFGAGGTLATQDAAVGPVRGTPVYMAPELLDGGRPTVQSDLYSLGVLLYFLVSGEFPVAGASLDDLRERHRLGNVTRLRDVRPDLPPEFIRAVDCATAADPAIRPASAGAMEALLESALGLRDGLPASSATGTGSGMPRGNVSTRRRLAGAGAIVMTLALLGWSGWLTFGSHGTVPAPTRDSVAILPFRDLTGSAGDDYFSEGITADLVANLTALRDLRVIAGASMLHYKNRTKTPMEIGAELKVATILDGSVRRSQERVRIVAHLVDARTGEQLWSDSFDRAIADIVEMKSDVAHRIAVALKGELSQRDVQSLRPGAKYDAEAFTLYLRGRHYWGLRTEDGVNRGIQFFHDALARDPGFAPAYAGLAAAYTQLGVFGSIPRREAFARAEAAAERAVALDGDLAEAHAALGYARKNRFRWQAAEESFIRAIDLKPGYATAHHWYSVFLTQHGRFQEAITEIKIALSLDPLSVAPNLQLASLLTMARRYDDAVAQYERLLKMDTDFATSYRHMANACAYKGSYDRALALLDEATKRTPVGSQDQELKAVAGYVLSASGREAEALRLADGLIERYHRTGEEVAVSIAAIYAGAKRIDSSLEWLTRARDAGDSEIGYLKVDPRWDNLRGDRRFAVLVKSLGFVDGGHAYGQDRSR